MKLTDPATIPDRNCATIHRELFFPAKTDTPGEREAQRACRGCPALDVCLDFALAIEAGVGLSGRHGIYGGMTPRQRAEIARRKGKAAWTTPQTLCPDCAEDAHNLDLCHHGEFAELAVGL